MDHRNSDLRENEIAQLNVVKFMCQKQLVSSTPLIPVQRFPRWGRGGSAGIHPDWGGDLCGGGWVGGGHVCVWVGGGAYFPHGVPKQSST